MMNCGSPRRIGPRVALAVAGGAVAAGALVVACTSSSNSAPPDASLAPDSGLDSTSAPDATATRDAADGGSANAVDAADAFAPDSSDGGSATDAPRDGAPQSCTNLALSDAGAPSICSDSGATSAVLQVNNHCIESVDIWWVDYSCQEVFYQSIPSQQSAGQSSFLTHPWRVRLKDAGPLVKEIPPLGQHLTVVDVP
jgi:hypothetical protein